MNVFNGGEPKEGGYRPITDVAGELLHVIRE
jgi:hypothetical protein